MSMKTNVAALVSPPNVVYGIFLLIRCCLRKNVVAASLKRILLQFYDKRYSYNNIYDGVYTDLLSH